MNRRAGRRRLHEWAAGALTLLLSLQPLSAGPYVTQTSGIRWDDVGGLRWDDVGGIRWDDVGGLRWNDVGGIRWDDVGGLLFTDASGIRWDDVGGLRWNDVGALGFDDAIATGVRAIDLELLNLLSILPDSSTINVIVTYRSYPGAADLAALASIGIAGGTIYRRLPMLVVNATKDQIRSIAAMPAVRSVWADRTLSIFDADSRALIGLDDAESDPFLTPPGTPGYTGQGVTIAVIDSGVDAGHPDLPYGTKVVENVRLSTSVGAGPGFTSPIPVEGVLDTDLVLGHGTFVASVAAGTGAASGGLYRGAAPGASILGLSAGDLKIIDVLEGFDYVIENAARFNVRVVNCSWGTQGFFDPDDPVNIATRILYDAGISVVFAAGNNGPSPDTLNPYSVAPWVVGVGSTRKDGTLSSWSSRGIYEEILYHPMLVAPGEGIIAAASAPVGGVFGVTGVADPAAGVVVPPAFAPWYTVASGTSFAAPHVAGVIAAMLQARPAMTQQEIWRRLQATATPILTRDRSEIGAGRIDAWAALTSTLDPSRPFGTHVAGWLDQRPFRIDHQTPIQTAASLPASGTTIIPVSIPAGAVSWKAYASWPLLPSLSDIDVVVKEASGAVVARSESYSGSSALARAEGAGVGGPMSASLWMTFARKGGPAPADQPFDLLQETATAAVTAYGDLGGLTASEAARVATAVARRAIAGHGGLFDPQAALARGDLARSLALIAGLPQRIPALASFSDVDTADPLFPYVESAAGAHAERAIMDPKSAGLFGGTTAVARLDFAVSLVRAAGRQAEADARAGETLGLTDENKIPDALRGYAAVALEQHFIDTLPAPGGRKFDPKGTLTRVSATDFLLELLLDLEGRSSPCCAGTASSGSGGSRDMPLKPRN